MIRNIAHEVELEKGRKNISEISRRSGYNRRITIPNPQEITKGTLKSIIRQAGLTREEFLKLL